ncbi:hypothetical protein K450DRAFT_255563 [Umbelopsis ramanniana AG]|uniref:Uncharacterized protein n=1 Tax=Umbelopsis ramanniana AG TaxID=1314678 RepID=A0AAD5E5M9_UMBRA|nr:uncharacterized protein K450DRAFT_255563 [Umbelopsis ramanniana AG]KAI8576776.1 hypothetical protein K450DRAFT_255563 [Umbelopsis ramanniana AG]
MEPEKLDGDWAWITWNDLAKEDNQYRPLFLPLQNLLLTYNIEIIKLRNTIFHLVQIKIKSSFATYG